MIDLSLFPKVQIFILSYNRPEFITEALTSILKQEYPNFEVILSDNSTTDDVKNLLEKHGLLEQIRYVRRSPSLSSMNHFNAILSQVTADFFVMFHDDDVVLPNAVSLLMQNMTSAKECVAVAGNGLIINDREQSPELFNPQIKASCTLDSADDLAVRYLDSGKGHPPFPAYLYRRSATEGVRVNVKQGGKHFDVSFLIKLSERGPMLWLPDPIILYRRHSGNDSVKIDLRAIFSLCRFLKRHVSRNLHETIQEFKMKHCVLWMRQQRKNPRSSLSHLQQRIVRRAAIRFIVSHPQLLTKSALNKCLRALGF